jgi:vacuolar protein sorting-associated protein 13D
LGENLDDLQTMVVSNSDDFSHATLTDDFDTVWTCVFMDIQLQDVILDIVPQRLGPCLARINFFKSRLIFESFSDSSRDVDLVSQEILLSDLRFADLPMNKRSSVFDKILQPMANR